MATAEAGVEEYTLERTTDGLVVGLRGAWSLSNGVPPIGPVLEALDSAVRRLVLRAEDLGGWDSSLVAFVHSLAGEAAARGVDVDWTALPEGARKLLDLARAVPPRPTAPSSEDDSLLARVGRPALA